MFQRLCDLVVIRGLAGASVPPGVTIGNRVSFVHDAFGLVINPAAVVGDDCRIFHQVTIGDIWGKAGAPRIGNGVLIGPGAKILGPVTIGDYVAIGANAVVTKDIPEGATVVAGKPRVFPAGDDLPKIPRR